MYVIYQVLRKTGEELEPLPAESRGFHKSISTPSTREILEPPHPLPSSSSSSSPFSSFRSDPVGGSSLPPPPSSLFYNIHLSNPLDNFRHHQHVAESVKKLQSEVTSTTSTQMQLCKEWAGTKEDFTLLQVSHSVNAMPPPPPPPPKIKNKKNYIPSRKEKKEIRNVI